jgi:hypothetical protein
LTTALIPVLYRVLTMPAILGDGAFTAVSEVALRGSLSFTSISTLAIAGGLCDRLVDVKHRRRNEHPVRDVATVDSLDL